MTIEKIHEKSYNKVAQEYNAKFNKNLKIQKRVLKNFKHLLEKRFPEKIKILDIGCGVGADLKVFDDKKYILNGLDISKEMIKFAGKNVSNAKFEVIDFKKIKASKSFHGIICDAFIHLFKKNEAKFILNKIKKMLKPNGLVFISTTKHLFSKEGFFKKEGYIKQVKRFRKFWTEEEFSNFIKENKLKILDVNYEKQSNSANLWMNYVISLD